MNVTVEDDMADPTVLSSGLTRHRARNFLHKALLLLAMAGLLGALGWLFGGFQGLMLAFGLGFFFMLVSPSFSPKIILRMYGARPLDPDRAPEVAEIVRELSRRADLDMPPDLYVLPIRFLNAVSVGSGDDRALGVTVGLLQILDRRELTAVIGHELGHLATGDTRVTQLADVLGRVTEVMGSIGKLLLFLNLAFWVLGEPIVSWLVIAILIFAPVVSGLLQLALARTREFSADLNAVRLTGDPEGLARALRKLEEVNESLVRRFLVPGYRDRAPSVLRSHPHIDARIERLEDLESDVERRPVDTDTGGHSLSAA
jgi:heat shock protein HtpX